MMPPTYLIRAELNDSFDVELVLYRVPPSPNGFVTVDRERVTHILVTDGKLDRPLMKNYVSILKRHARDDREAYETAEVRLNSARSMLVALGGDLAF